jgi:hypothetical protein
MKISVSLLLILFLCFEFISLASSVEDSNTLSQNIEFTGIDCHSEGVDEQHESDEHHDAHGDCHIGHSHTAIISTDFQIKSLASKRASNRFHLKSLINLKDFHSRINRPPIA